MFIFVFVLLLVLFFTLADFLLLKCLTCVTTGSLHAGFFAGSHDYFTIVSIARLPMSPRKDTQRSFASLLFLFATFKGLFIGFGICRRLAAVYLLAKTQTHVVNKIHLSFYIKFSPHLQHRKNKKTSFYI